MRLSDNTRTWLVAAALFLAATLLAWAIEARGQEDIPHPAISITSVQFESGVPDVAKLESRAVAILRKRGKTLAEARALVRIDGQASPELCRAVIVDYALRSITQLQVTNVRVMQEMPPRPAEP